MTMAVDPLASLMSPSNNTTSVAAAAASGTPTQNQFLQMLVAELSHQDPLNPQQGTDFIAQLAQFSSLQETAQTNTDLTTIATGQTASQNASLAGFIGKSITARSGTVSLDGQDPASMVVHLDGAANKVQLTITDAQGNTVRTLTLPAESAGDIPLSWDGKDNNGHTLGAGTYNVAIAATSAGGAAVSSYVAVKGVVSALQFAASGAQFLVGGAAVAPADIVTVNN